MFEFKKAYEKLKSSQQDITKIDSKKRGRPKLLPKDLMKKTIETVQSTERGTNNSCIINAIAKGIVIANDRMLLVENGRHIFFSDSWARNIFNKMERHGKKTKRRMATTCKSLVAPALLEEEKFTFQRNTVTLVKKKTQNSWRTDFKLSPDTPFLRVHQQYNS